MTCQTKVVQRFFLDKNQELNDAVKDYGIKQVLAGHGVDITGTAVLRHGKESRSYLRMMVENFGEFWGAAKHPDTWPFYLFIIACYAIAAIVLLA